MYTQNLKKFSIFIDFFFIELFHLKLIFQRRKNSFKNIFIQTILKFCHDYNL